MARCSIPRSPPRGTRVTTCPGRHRSRIPGSHSADTIDRSLVPATSSPASSRAPADDGDARNPSRGHKSARTTPESAAVEKTHAHSACTPTPRRRARRRRQWRHRVDSRPACKSDSQSAVPMNRPEHDSRRGRRATAARIPVRSRRGLARFRPAADAAVRTDDEQNGPDRRPGGRLGVRTW